MMWNSTYYLKVTVHQILTELCPFENFRKLFFPANSYSLHQIELKLNLYLDHDVEQHILFQGHSPSNINRVMPLCNFL